MTEYLRVRDTSGHEITVRGDVSDGHPRGFQEGQELLNKPALSRSRTPLPPKYRVPLGSGPAPSAVIGTHRPVTTDPVPALDPEPEDTEGHPLADTDKE